MEKNPSVAVIGAGLSGLACATALQAAGWAVQVFEKSRGPSGRMSTRRGEAWQCDHGAQYFTARAAPFRAELARWHAAGVAAPWQPRLQVFGDAERHRAETGLERWVGVPRMTSPAARLAQALPLHLEHTVDAVQRSDAGWRVHTREHGLHASTFDALVVAVPAPQVGPLLHGPAPGLAAIAAQARMRACWALMLRYDAPVALPFDAAFVNRGPLRWVARDSSKPGRPAAETWLLHASPEWSEAEVEREPEAVAAVLLAAFTEFGAPAPPSWTAHRWRFADTAPPLQQGFAWEPSLAAGLCGDWLHGGRVEGAWLSGTSLAGRMATARPA